MQTNDFFHSGAIMRYPAGFKPGQLKHTFDPNGRTRSDGTAIDFKKAFLLLECLNKQVAAKYEDKTKKKFDKYHLGEDRDWVTNQYYKDEKFLEALSLLGHTKDAAELIRIPWWNEIAASEISHNFTGEQANVAIAPRHSFETQLVRSGMMIEGLKSISVGSIIFTNDGNIAIGLRGGAAYPNTYHINAGALGLTDGLKSNTQTIYQFFMDKELKDEFGVLENDIMIERVGSRIEDNSIERGPMYVFHVHVNLAFSALEGRYEANKHEDKGEHTRIVKIENSPEAIWKFVEKYYRGIAENMEKRPESKRLLLHPGALALCAHIGRGISELAELYKEGRW